MGRRIRYRRIAPREQITVPGGIPPGRGRSQNTILILAVVWLVLLVVIVLGGYFFLQYRQFQNEFGPLIGVCQGERVNVTSTYSSTPGVHPAIAVIKRSGQYQLDTHLIPKAARAQSLAETQVVLCLGPVHEVFIESCPYVLKEGPLAGTTRTVERYYYKQEGELIEAKTGRVVTLEAFTGKSAHYCYEVEKFREDERVMKLKGTQISDADIQKWAESHLIIE
jgi:hypothetical protein